MASSPGASFPHQLLYRWDPIFDTPQNISDRHDEPFLKVRDEFDTASDFINCFMQVFDENDFCHHATDTVANFCAGANPNSLKDNASARTDPIAVLDDSNALTSWELYEALKSLFVSNENLKGKGKENNVSIRQTTTQNKASKRGIHRLYIASLNRWAVIALAANAPNHQAGILGEFIFNHLQFDPLIKAKILPGGFPVFALEFHLPYFALRKHRLPQRDSRRYANGDELRQSQDITFLRTMDSKVDNSLTEYVYEAKLSCLVSGSNRDSWSAYLFNDLYFEIDEDSESILHYDAQEGTGSMLDPLTAGKRSTIVSGDPREYFLIVLEVRLGLVKKEWEQLFMVVDGAIRAYDYWNKTCSLTSCRKDDQTAYSDADRQRTQLREELQEWLRRSIEILRKFISLLNEYSNEWNLFSDTGFNYLMSTDEAKHPARLHNSLASVRQQVADLRRLLFKFNCTMRLCEDMSRDVNLLIAHENNESALFQQKTARDVKVLTWITFLSLPFALAASLLSTQQGFIPITPSFGAFIASITLLEALVWLVLGVLRAVLPAWLGWAQNKTRMGTTPGCDQE
ncbi:hypothetical protein F4819DRAFT_65300 [Hypoxylon fuscum]|nr:hypothetical protein F4819DRAFT_65300 [Hypoxylon fuscum]